MARWAVFVVIALLNLLGALFVVVPTLVTYADVVPHGIDCAACDAYEVQQALIKAASIGRGQVLRQVQGYAWLAAGMFGLNIVFLAAVLFQQRRLPRR